MHKCGSPFAFQGLMKYADAFGIRSICRKPLWLQRPRPIAIHWQNGKPHLRRGLRHKRFSSSLSVGGLVPLGGGIDRVILKGTDDTDILAKSDSGVARAQTDGQRPPLNCLWRGRRSRIGFRQNCVCRRHLRT